MKFMQRTQTQRGHNPHQRAARLLSRSSIGWLVILAVFVGYVIFGG